MPLPNSRFYLVSLLVLASISSYSYLVFHLHARTPASDPAINVFTEPSFSADQGLHWHATQLPHEWQLESLAINEGWYRHHFSLSAMPVSLETLYIPNVSQNLAVYLNGIEVGNGGSLETPVARNWPRPLFFTIAPDLFLIGQNELLILVVSRTGRGLLGPVYLGDRELLDRAFANRVNLKETVPMASAIVLSLFSILLCTITLGRPGDTQYAWGGASLLFLAGHSLPLLISRTPVSDFHWDWWRHTCIGFAVVCILVFTNRFLGLRFPKLEGSLVILVSISTIVSLSIGFAGHEAWYFNWGDKYWGALAVTMGLFPTTILAHKVWTEQNHQHIILLGAGSMLFGFGVHDALFVLGILPRQNGYMIHFASPVAALLFTYILFNRFVLASQRADELNRTLEQRITEKGKELARSYEQVRRLERQALIAQERERFNQDLHDGLGGHLAGALALAENTTGNEARLVTALKDATDEMRLMIDSAEASGNDLGMVLGTFRPKLERQLNHSDFSLEWHILETQEVEALGPAAAMQLIRFAQETATNAIKHSGGSVFRVSLQDCDDGGIELSFSCDGSCTKTQRQGGCGMSNLHRRAKQLNTSISVIPAGTLGGLSVILKWAALKPTHSTHPSNSDPLAL